MPFASAHDLHTPLAAGERYPSAIELFAAPDLAEQPMTPGILRADGTIEPYWTFPDGTPMRVLVRAPSLQEQRDIEQAAGEDDILHVIETLICCTKEPALSREKAVMLYDKNPAPLLQMYQAIWDLADYPRALVQRETERILGLRAATREPASHADPGHPGE